MSLYRCYVTFSLEYTYAILCFSTEDLQKSQKELQEVKRSYYCYLLLRQTLDMEYSNK